jgi:hypothetical protein
MKGIQLASIAAVAAALLKHWKIGKALATFTPER